MLLIFPLPSPGAFTLWRLAAPSALIKMHFLRQVIQLCFPDNFTVYIISPGGVGTCICIACKFVLQQHCDSNSGEALPRTMYLELVWKDRSKYNDAKRWRNFPLLVPVTLLRFESVKGPAETSGWLTVRQRLSNVNWYSVTFFSHYL